MGQDERRKVRSRRAPREERWRWDEAEDQEPYPDGSASARQARWEWLDPDEEQAELAAAPADGSREPTRDAPLAALGLRPPCSTEDVRRAYRRLAQRLHPDKGGDGAAFAALQADYRRALRLLAEADE
jgi:hypothetical protein